MYIPKSYSDFGFGRVEGLPIRADNFPMALTTYLFQYWSLRGSYSYYKFLVTVSVTILFYELGLLTLSSTPLDSEGQWFFCQCVLSLATGFSYFKAPDARLLPLPLSF